MEMGKALILSILLLPTTTLSCFPESWRTNKKRTIMCIRKKDEIETRIQGREQAYVMLREELTLNL